jgi:hypothetical protein
MILLYEPSFNQNSKKLGRDMMYTAERSEPKEEHGDRKEVAVEQCLNKRLFFAILRQLKCPLAMRSNYAKSYYDRIVHSVLSGKPLYATSRSGLDTLANSLDNASPSLDFSSSC